MKNRLEEIRRNKGIRQEEPPCALFGQGLSGIVSVRILKKNPDRKRQMEI